MAVQLLLLVGGAVVVGGIAAAAAATSSRSSSDPRLILRTPIIPKFQATPPASSSKVDDKFQDPIYECWGTGPVSGLAYRWRLWSPLTGKEEKIGLEYLTGVPANASARVAAMRARIGPKQPAQVSFPKTQLGGIAEASFRQIQNVAIKLRNAYGSAAGYAEIAKAFGVPVDVVKRQAADVVSLASKYGGAQQAEFVAAAAKYAPIAKTLLTSVTQWASTGEFNQAAAIEAVGSVLAAAVGSAVPVIGTLISAATSAAAAFVRDQRAFKAATCKEARDKILGTGEAAMAENFPPLWHLFDDFGAICDVNDKMDAAKRNAMGDVAAGSYVLFRKLSTNDKANVARWWSTAVTMMSHPDVFQAFDKLGRGGAFYDENHTVPLSGDGLDKGYASERSNGAIYGGVLASDEQVMLVAIPIAVAAGLDPDELARRLYERSGGWRTADAASFVYAPKGFRTFTGVNWDGDAGTPQYDYRCPGIVANAWWLQWAALSRDAFKIADEMIAARKS